MIPEVVNFLASSLLVLSPKAIAKSHVPGLIPCGDLTSSEGQERLRGVRLQKTKADITLGPTNLAQILLEDVESQQTKAEVFATTVELIRSSSSMYAELDAFVELYEPVVELLGVVGTSRLPKALQVCDISNKHSLSFFPSDLISQSLLCTLDPYQGRRRWPAPPNTVCQGSSTTSSDADPQTYPYPAIYPEVRRRLLSRPQEGPRPRAKRGEEGQGSVQEGTKGCYPRVAQGQQVPCGRASQGTEDEGRGLREEDATSPRRDRDQRESGGEGDGKVSYFYSFLVLTFLEIIADTKSVFKQ